MRTVAMQKIPILSLVKYYDIWNGPEGLEDVGYLVGEGAVWANKHIVSNCLSENLHLAQQIKKKCIPELLNINKTYTR